MGNLRDKIPVSQKIHVQVGDTPKRTIIFEYVIPRNGTSSLKCDGRVAHLSRNDVIPLWVADMDLPAPEAVQCALVARAAHPIYGYTGYPNRCTTWLDKRHG